MPNARHIGRFAPSPTGPLHMGSLVAALGSWLCARKQHGAWHLRIEDLDPPREQPDAVPQIFESLETHGLDWDGEVVYQSQRHEAYQQVIDTLLREDQAYYCQCSRKQVMAHAAQGKMGPIYNGRCRDLGLTEGAVRLHVNDIPVEFTDAVLGRMSQRLETELGDFVIQRRDGLFAYQLAVVVDDAQQQITDVVRGKDLLDNTARQRYLQKQIGYPSLKYLHLPLVTHSNGQKLSKQNQAKPLDNERASDNLIYCLDFLGFDTAELPSREPPQQLLRWALHKASWSRTAIASYAS